MEQRGERHRGVIDHDAYNEGFVPHLYPSLKKHTPHFVLTKIRRQNEMKTHQETSRCGHTLHVSPGQRKMIATVVADDKDQNE